MEQLKLEQALTGMNIFNIFYIMKNDRARAIKVIKDWQQHKEDFFNKSYWEKRFAPFNEIFEKYKPKVPVQLFRNERTDIDNKYDQRYSSWSLRENVIEKFGWGERRMVTSIFRPADILVSLVHLNLDDEQMSEVIVKPGIYDIKPYKLVWDRHGAFNYYDDPERYDKKLFSWH